VTVAAYALGPNAALNAKVAPAIATANVRHLALPRMTLVVRRLVDRSELGVSMMVMASGPFGFGRTVAALLGRTTERSVTGR
jgi:hypothetical protein